MNFRTHFGQFEFWLCDEHVNTLEAATPAPTLTRCSLPPSTALVLQIQVTSKYFVGSMTPIVLTALLVARRREKFGTKDNNNLTRLCQIYNGGDCNQPIALGLILFFANAKNKISRVDNHQSIEFLKRLDIDREKL